jgi:hypothetical protein
MGVVVASAEHEPIGGLEVKPPVRSRGGAKPLVRVSGAKNTEFCHDLVTYFEL